MVEARDDEMTVASGGSSSSAVVPGLALGLEAPHDHALPVAFSGAR